MMTCYVEPGETVNCIRCALLGATRFHNNVSEYLYYW